jgi:hypothetical protein
MTTNKPPAIATWLWKHFGCGPNQDVLLGDLTEQYLQKGSSLWYWRQVLKAIPISVLKELRAHSWIAARAVLAGWTIWTLFIVLIYPLFTTAFFGGNAVGVEIQPLHPVGSAWSVLWAPILLPVNLSPSSPLAFLVLIQIALPLVVWAMVGWIVARVDIGLDTEDSSGPRLVVRFHRDLVFLFAGSILLLNILLVGPFLSFVGAPAYRFIAPLAAHAVASVLAILLGGSLGGSKKPNLG